jgi:hypothetical protein
MLPERSARARASLRSGLVAVPAESGISKGMVRNWYAVRQVLAIVAEEQERFVVITVYAFYF